VFAVTAVKSGEDPGFGEDPGDSNAPNTPQGPDPPRKMLDIPYF
jgi:hypothetical protein